MKTYFKSIAASRKGLAVFVGCALLAVGQSFGATMLQWQTNSGFRHAALTVPAGAKAGFTLMPPTATGVAFTNLLPQWRHLTNQVLLNGSGVAAGDVDGDGLCDVYLCNSTGPNALYRNLGNWRFMATANNTLTYTKTHVTGSGHPFCDAPDVALGSHF